MGHPFGYEGVLIRINVCDFVSNLYLEKVGRMQLLYSIWSFFDVSVKVAMNDLSKTRNKRKFVRF